MATPAYAAKLNEYHAQQIQLAAQIEALTEQLSTVKANVLATLDKHSLKSFDTTHGKITKVEGEDTVIDTLKFKALVTSEQFDQCVKVQVTKAKDYVSKVMLDTVSTKVAKTPFVKFTEKTKKA